MYRHYNYKLIRSFKEILVGNNLKIKIKKKKHFKYFNSYMYMVYTQ